MPTHLRQAHARIVCVCVCTHMRVLPCTSLPCLCVGRNVLLIMSMEHRGAVSKAAFSLARLGVKNIVDRLHVRVSRAAPVCGRAGVCAYARACVRTRACAYTFAACALALCIGVTEARCLRTSIVCMYVYMSLRRKCLNAIALVYVVVWDE